MKDILHSYFLATHYDPTWYKAWHTWALANFEVIGYLDNQTENRTVDIPGDGLAAHIVQAVQGELTVTADSFWFSHRLSIRLFPLDRFTERECAAGYTTITDLVVQIWRSRRC